MTVIGSVAITGAPTGNSVYAVTGTATGQTAGFYGRLNFNTSPDNNFISLTGCIPGLSVGLDANGNCDPILLMSGTFTGFTDGPNGLLLAVGADFKAEELMDAIGWSTELPWEFFGFSMTTRRHCSPSWAPPSSLALHSLALMILPNGAGPIAMASLAKPGCSRNGRRKVRSSSGR